MRESSRTLGLATPLQVTQKDDDINVGYVNGLNDGGSESNLCSE